MLRGKIRSELMTDAHRILDDLSQSFEFKRPFKNLIDERVTKVRQQIDGNLRNDKGPAGFGLGGLVEKIASATSGSRRQQEQPQETVISAKPIIGGQIITVRRPDGSTEERKIMIGSNSGSTIGRVQTM